MKLPLVETSYKNVVPNQNYTEIVFLAIKVYLSFASELLNSIRVINFRMNVGVLCYRTANLRNYETK